MQLPTKLIQKLKEFRKKFVGFSSKFTKTRPNQKTAQENTSTDTREDITKLKKRIILGQTKNKKKSLHISRINKKKTKLILFVLSIAIFFIIVFGILEPQEKRTVKNTNNEQSKNTNVPSDFIITADDRKRYEEEDPFLNTNNTAETKINTNNISIPLDFRDDRADKNIKTSDTHPLERLGNYQLVAENISKKSTGLFVQNWNNKGVESGIAGLASNLSSNLTRGLQNTGIDNSAKIAQALGQAQNSYLSQNQQQAKQDFVDNAQNGFDERMEVTKIETLKNPYTIIAGSVIPITLITGINSDLPGSIVAQVNRNVYDSVSSNYLLIPAGSKVVGKYDSGVSWGQRRVLVIWSRLVLPNGSSINLRGMQGVNLDGFSGYSDTIDAHIPEIVGITLASTVLSLGTEQIDTLGTSQANEQLRALTNSLSNGASRTSDILSQIAEKIVNLQPSIKIRHGKRANIFVSRDMVLEPYVRTY